MSISMVGGFPEVWRWSIFNHCTCCKIFQIHFWAECDTWGCADEIISVVPYLHYHTKDNRKQSQWWRSMPPRVGNANPSSTSLHKIWLEGPWPPMHPHITVSILAHIHKPLGKCGGTWKFVLYEALPQILAIWQCHPSLWLASPNLQAFWQDIS